MPVVLAEPLGQAAEALGALRTRIQSQHILQGRRALAICGATPDVGCTFIAVNLAVSLSQIGIKTLLVDGNMREPEVQNYFEIEDVGGGLEACLSTTGQSADYIHEEVLPGLDVLFAGQPTTKAQELLSGENFPVLMNSFLRDYEMTIVDTPPASRCADSLRISTVLGFSLVVARKNRTLVADLKTLTEQLKTERVAGVGSVLNAY